MLNKLLKIINNVKIMFLFLFVFMIIPFNKVNFLILFLILNIIRKKYIHNFLLRYKKKELSLQKNIKS